MKRLFVILFLIPSLCFGAYTEFYCNPSTGSNLNAGSTSTGAALYTSTSGNWVQSTRVFTPTDGINPVSAGVAVGMYASVYVNAASVTGYLGKISAVANATNGTITIDSTVNTQIPPSNSTGGMSIKVGGTWKGPNAADGFPFNMGQFDSLGVTPASVRVNMNDAASYSVTAQISGVTQAGVTYQGFDTTVGDGSKATIDQGTTAAIILSLGQGAKVIDLKFVSSATSGTNTGLTLNGNNAAYRCVVHGSRGIGISCSSQALVVECEVYDFNKSNTATSPGISVGGESVISGNYLHDATAGTNCSGIITGPGTDARMITSNIMDTLSGDGIVVASGSASSIITHLILNNTIYNCRNGISVAATAGRYFLIIQNNILIKNSAAGFEGNTSFTQLEGAFYNNAYGSGTFANGSGNYLHTGNMVLDDGTGNSTRVVIASNTSPFVAETTGNFSLNLPALEGVGRQFFTQTDGTNTGTVGYPDIGAAQANIGVSFPTPTPTPTVTPTPTPTPTPTEVSYGFSG